MVTHCLHTVHTVTPPLHTDAGSTLNTVVIPRPPHLEYWVHGTQDINFKTSDYFGKSEHHSVETVLVKDIICLQNK